jgi:YVTN family beta-propeller protein
MTPTMGDADRGPSTRRGRTSGRRSLRAVSRTAILGVVLASLGVATMAPPAVAAPGDPGTASVSRGAFSGWGRPTHHDLSWGIGSARQGSAPTVPVGQNPVGVAVDQATGTVYVGNGNEDTVSVINGATCNRTTRAGCSESPTTITVGSNPLGLAIDQATHTLYVVNAGSNTVSVVNTSTCNAAVTTGCGAVRTITVGNFPTFDAVDQATDTVYVANFADNTASVIDGATCNGVVGSGCAAAPPVVQVGSGPQGVAVDESTDTVYTTNGNDNSVSVINGATCNAGTSAGCGQTPAEVHVAGSPGEAVVDEHTHTVYAGYALNSLGAVALIDGTRCNGLVHSGCAQAPGVVQAGSNPIGVAEDPVTGTVYVANQEDSNVSVINARTCNATTRYGCSSPLPAMAGAYDAGGVDVDTATDTVYYTSQSENDVTVLDGSRCNAEQTHGCTRYAPTTTTGNGASFTAVNQRTDTVYVTNQEDGTVSVINGAVCNVVVRRGCGSPWPTIAVGAFPKGIAVDEQTDTVYVANSGGGTVSVIDGATCNAGDHTGCGQIPTTVAVGVQPDQLAVDEATNTIYVANNGGDTSGGNTVSVIDGVTCNATERSDCGSLATIQVGHAPYGIAVNQRDNTVYVANVVDGTLSVVNGSRCDAETTVGCGDAVPTVAAGTRPGVLGVDQATDTVYVADGLFDFLPTASLAVIDGAGCNGVNTAGCSQTPQFMTTGGTPVGLAIDEASDTVYVTSIIDSDTNVFDGSTCNSVASRGCGQTPVEVPTGGWSAGVALNSRTHTVYVADNVDAELSLF